MGTDIHIYAERWAGAGWHRSPIVVPDDRNYWAFAILADVRNGYGFAGHDTGLPLTPIAPPRGIPPDTCILNTETEDCDAPGYVWLGDHGFSWVLLSELRALNLDQPVTIIGMVAQVTAHALDTQGLAPSEWCTWCTIPGYVTRSWQRPLREAAPLLPEILEAFKDEQEPTHIRLVFGFDS
jgi:hypothetical protein